MMFGSDIGRSTGRTPFVDERAESLLERWDRTDHKETVNRDEIRRAIAIAQAVDEFRGELSNVSAAAAKQAILRRADELLRGDAAQAAKDQR